MALDVLVTTDRIQRDPLGRNFLEYITQNAGRLGLDDGVLYYDFPTYSDYETVAHKPDALIVSKTAGIVALRLFDSGAPLLNRQSADEIDESLAQFCSILIGRLLKSRLLRAGLSQLAFPVTPVVVLLDPAVREIQLELSQPVQSFDSLGNLILGLGAQRLDDKSFAEMRSVIEGAKALSRPQRRTIADPATQKQATALAELEAEIANFDQKQRRAALISAPGPQRIRGLAGSGKTVILAMKAAHLHLTRPDETILVTFFTRSLRASIKNMITRFYRHYKDEDPNWTKIHVRHGWGGSGNPGVYSDASQREGRLARTFTAAQQLSPGGDTFDYVCRELAGFGVSAFYDHILIDEGQDFPSGFYELCFQLAKGSRDKKNIVWAYDELQNILNVKIRSPDALFGNDTDGQPRISLERAAIGLPPGAENDTVLSKCYRNQREVLVTAHALGFGIYRGIVQLLESREHWEDVGYEVLENRDFVVGQPVRIERPTENNPISLSAAQAGPTIQTHVAASFDDEVSWVANNVLGFLAGGLVPEDIIIVALDDRNARRYFKSLSVELSKLGISTNNILADPYSEPPFQLAGRVTLSTVYRAKGNEAAVVFAIGVDGVRTAFRSGRNKLFVAFTRTKAWLRVSGVGMNAEAICSEIQDALDHIPYLDFTMPNLAEVEFIQRDLSRRSIRAKEIKEEYFQRLRSEGLSEEEIAELLSADTPSE